MDFDNPQKWPVSDSDGETRLDRIQRVLRLVRTGEEPADGIENIEYRERDGMDIIAVTFEE
jgi:hypothetical protein